MYNFNSFPPQLIMPWADAPGNTKIRSLYDMFPMQSEDLMSGLHVLVQSMLDVTSSSDPAEAWEKWIDKRPAFMGAVILLAERYELKTTLNRIELMYKRTKGKRVNSKIGGSELQGIIDTLICETQSKVFLFLESPDVYYYQTPAIIFFGETFLLRYELSAPDLDEALKCMALQRWTAAVFHCCRVVENVCQAVWFSLGSGHTKCRGGFGEYYGKITKFIDTPGSIAKVKGWKEYPSLPAEIKDRLGSIKDVWRNPTAHPDAFYEKAEAENFLYASKSFFQKTAEYINHMGVFVADVKTS